MGPLLPIIDLPNLGMFEPTFSTPDTFQVKTLTKIYD